MKASLEASKILLYITSCKLGEGSAWCRPTASFVLHWQNQVSQERVIFLEWPEETHASECSAPCSRVTCGQDSSRPTQDSGRKGLDVRSICQPTSFCCICIRYPVCTEDSLCCTISLSCCVLSRYHRINDPAYDIDSASSRPTDIQPVHLAAPPSMALSQRPQLSQDAKDIWDKLTDEAKGIILDHQRACVVG
jgi:hypothetical protein